MISAPPGSLIEVMESDVYILLFANQVIVCDSSDMRSS